VELVAEARKAM
jgi:hypothetical protein